MSNGDSLDGFVFPPFIPTAAARPAEPPAPAAPPPAAPEPPAEPQEAAGRMTMPWDLETPIVREADTAPAGAAPAGGEAEETEDGADDEEDLPWLERPAPREPVAEAPAPAPEPAAPAQDEAFPDWLAWDDRATDEARSEVEGTAHVEGLEEFLGVSDVDLAEPAATVDWAEAAPPVAEEEPSATTDAASEIPAFEVTVEDDGLTFAPAAEPEAETVAEAAPAVEPVADAPVAEEPFVADAEAVIAAEPDPFTAAAVNEAEVAEPAVAASGAFAQVAARLEEIARTLRERPDELLSGAASDPLALLVAGYVMGYNARR